MPHSNAAPPLSLLFDAIARTAPLSESDTALCAQALQPFALPKNSVAEAAGDVPQHLYFISAGYMRLYYADERGEEATTYLPTYLAGPADFLTPFLPFIHAQKSSESLACLSACQGLRISRSDLVALIDASAAFKAFSLLIFEQAIAATGQRANSLAALSGEQRYQQLLATRPDLLLHVPVQHRASYLGLKRESLSRIRRQALL